MKLCKFYSKAMLATLLTMSLSCEDVEESYDSDSTDEKTSRVSVLSSSSPLLQNSKTHEAENRTGASGCKVATEHAGFNGAGFVDFGGNGTWIEWNNIFAASADEHTLTFRYGNGSGGNRQAAVVVNGQQKAVVPFPPTGSWKNWRTTTAKVVLRKGNNTIRILANTGAGGPNLDSMTVAGKEDPIGGSSHCALADENKAAIIACPPGETIVKIDFASYGLPAGSCNTGFSINGSCHAVGSQAKVESLCLGRTGNIVSAKNTVFGDPCPGKYKKLAVQFRCTGDQIEPCTNTLLSQEKLFPGEHICSQNGNYQFGLTTNGELVIRSNTKKLWSAGTFGSNVHVIMQGDGNLVVYDNVARPLWDTATHGNLGATLKLENDGRVVIRLGSSTLWSSGGGKIDASTLTNKIMAGYQGWFYAKNDGGYNKWNHWCNNKQDKPKPDNVLFDMWPDLREFPANELYPTGFTYANGSNARLYSAYNASTVERHMKWCQDYGIDGVFVQRFMAAIHDGHRAYRDKVLLNVKAGAEKHGRVFVNMWDINSLESKNSGWHNAGLVDKIKNDWMHLVDDLKITGSDRYLKHNGKPLVAIWGVSKMTVMDAKYADDLVDWFRKDAAPKYRASVMLGVTNEVGSSHVDWRKKSSSWQNVFRKVDVISPWTVGRFKNESGADDFYNEHVKPDKQKCDEYGVDYFPVVYPGFSACQKHDKPCNATPRNGGKFLWRQFYNVMRAGSKMVYVAMFDEVDEGTAIYKIAENQKQTPVQWPSNHHHHEFIVMDADGYKLPSDWYLRLTGEASKMLRKNINLTATIPIQP